MPIPIIELEFDDSHTVEIHCPACGAQILAQEVFPPPACEHVEFASFPSCDLEYIAAELEASVEEWREKAEEAGEGFDLVDALCENRDTSASFVFAIKWEGMPETMWVGFRLQVKEPERESHDEG